MKILEKKIPNKCNLYFIGDIHLPRGKRNKFQQTVEEISKDKHGKVIFLGDYCEYIKDGDPRYDPQEIAHYIQKYGDSVNMIQKQFTQFENDIKPLIDNKQILGLHEGNHEYQFRKRNSVNLLEMMCDRNDLEYLGSNYVYWKLNGTDDTTTLLTNHGCGGGTSIGYHLKKLDSASRILNKVHIIAQGHTHQLTVNASCGPLDVTSNNKLKQNTQYRCACGSFLGNYDLEVENYAEVQGYHPLPIGYVKAELDKGKIKSVQVVPV